jgi:hypothetical protein
MEAKLIKSIQEMFVQYHLKNENGHTIATTLFPIPTEVEYAANSRGITLQRLSYDNCQAIERGYDLDELAKTIFPDKIFTTDEEHETPVDGSPYQWGFKVGFQKALELMGDKKFSETQMREAYNRGYYLGGTPGIDRYINALQQTEWDVIVEMQRVEDGSKIIGAVKGVKGSGSKIKTYKSVPKLDADGCLILKLKS